MDVQDIRLVVQAMEARPSDTPSLMPGTISEVSEDGSTAILVMDSDPDGITVQARMLFADLGEGDRAMVMFDPPRGVYVVGTIGRRTEAGQIVVDYAQDVDDILIETDETQLIEFPSFTFYAEPNRMYRFDLTASLYVQAGGWNGCFDFQPQIDLSPWYFPGPNGSTSFYLDYQTCAYDSQQSRITGTVFGTTSYPEATLQTVDVFTYLKIDDPSSVGCYTFIHVLVTDSGPINAAQFIR